MAVFKRKVGQQQQQSVLVGNNENNKVFNDQVVVLIKGIPMALSRQINNIDKKNSSPDPSERIFSFRPAKDESKKEVNNFGKKNGDEKGEGSWLFEFIINSDKIEDFKALLPKIQEVLRTYNDTLKDKLLKSGVKPEDLSKRKGLMSDGFINGFVQNMSDKVDSMPSLSDIQNYREKMTKNWKELLSTINDPEVRKRLVRCVTINNANGELKSVPLSDENINIIRLQKPDATFVTDSATWYKIFKREVVNRGNGILIRKPIYTWANLNKEAKDALCQEQYGKSYEEMKAKCADKIQKQQLDHDLEKYWTRKQGRSLYYWSKVYDVSDTQCLDPNDDPYQKLIMTNNIDGGANPNANGDPNANNTEEEGNLETRIGLAGEQLEQYKEWLLKKCAKSRIDISSYLKLPTEEAVTRAIFAYAYENADEQGQVRNEDRSAFANAVLLGVCAVCGLRTNFVNMTISDELARLSWPVYLELLPKAEMFHKTEQPQQAVQNQNNAITTMVSESATNSFEDYLNILKSAGVKIVEEQNNEVLNEFFDTLNKLDNSKHNLNY